MIWLIRFTKIYKKTKASGKVLSDEALEISNNQHEIASIVYEFLD